ncbi:hypothetical protein ASD79_08920 [Caulobacter sp. Root655]|uniref:ATP-binding protein n=1 Tax=Caulobacter sp. Root655 TaxID=1736578 RepID=UPI0006F52E4A|nr:ATP-binding protein [Caulobacter sp. Root655]KRA60346.1 hypothetical protein ASD79_08920 [Caulobacter sp. Root655]
MTLSDPFAAMPQDAAGHFRLALLGVAGRLAELAAGEDRAGLLAACPFLAEYEAEIDRLFGATCPGAEAWRRAVEGWAARLPPTPLTALRRAGLATLDIDLLLTIGLVEEDPRFAALLAGDDGARPTLGVLIGLWRGHGDADRPEAVRAAVLNLLQAGLVHVLNPDAPRMAWRLAVSPALWDALGDACPEMRLAQRIPPESLTPLSAFIPPRAEAVEHPSWTALPDHLARQPGRLIVVRGPAHNGRKTLVGGVARALGLGLLRIDAAGLADEAHWRLCGALARLWGAMPLVELALVPGESRTLPSLPLWDGPIAVVMGPTGGVACADGRPILTLELSAPDAQARARHWREASPGGAPAERRRLAEDFHLTSGAIRRAAAAAEGYAALDRRADLTADDVRQAVRGLHDARIETVAARVRAEGGLGRLALERTARLELESLIARCRHREALAVAAGDGPGAAGVRALFSGPSGSGKTLAAQLVAAELGKDLYRIDLASAVSKYIGETEKNLDRAFAAAEDLDAMLLLDEGDALMARRTDVGNANDRYANLETNFLLQRIETFRGILLVTTNAAERIDKAFARRMDVVVPFRAPDEARRYEILERHLGDHAASDELLQEIACRCALSGGQLRNVALHARLLALSGDRPLDDEALRSALLREYRKTEAQCPLKPALSAG